MKLSVSPKLVDVLPLEHPISSNHELDLIQFTLDTFPDLICIEDADEIIRMANAAFCERTGLDYQRIIGKEFKQFIISRMSHSAQPNNAQQPEISKVIREEKTLVDASGEICQLDTLKIPLIDSANHFQGTFSISRDISLQKRHEEDRESLINKLRDTVSVLEKQSEVLKRLNSQLQDLATTDDLTKVNNRRFFDHHFNIEWRRSCRDRTPLALMMFDIDHFKRYNDYYGHTRGDLCLATVAQALKKQTCRRPGDVFARFGGEEFVSLLPNTSEGLASLAERCVKAVYDLDIPHLKSSVEGHVVTVSIGAVVSYPHLLESSHDLLDLADQQLYLAKQSGRNAYEYMQPDPGNDDSEGHTAAKESHSKSTTTQ